MRRVFFFSCKKADAHNMPVSASALWRIVSFTAAKTNRMFEVSVACVRLNAPLALTHNPGHGGTHCGYRFRCARLT